MVAKELIVINNAIKLEQNLIDDYWLLVKGKFKFNNAELAENYEFSTKDIIKIVVNKSNCKLNFGRCNKCEEAYSFKVKTKSDYFYILNRFSSRCDSCSPGYILLNKYELSIDTYAYYTPDYAIDNKLWEELAPIELEILKRIVKYKDKFLIYRHVFKGDVNNKEIWNIIEHIEDLGLIWIERDNSRKIKSFEYHIKLKKLILIDV